MNPSSPLANNMSKDNQDRMIEKFWVAYTEGSELKSRGFLNMADARRFSKSVNGKIFRGYPIANGN